jgi:hypothetical protein
MPRWPDYLLMPPRLFNRARMGNTDLTPNQYRAGAGQYGSFKFDEMPYIFSQLLSQLVFGIAARIAKSIAPGHARYK